MQDNLIPNAIENTYSLVIEGKTIEEIFENEETDIAIYFVEPEEITPSDVDEMIEHFEYFEEYEKCLKLQEYKIFLYKLNTILFG